MRRWLVSLFVLLLGLPLFAAGPAARTHLQPKDVFQLEWASDPQISPDGKRIVYVRNFMDIMKDRRRSNLWVINRDGTGHQALTTGSFSDTAPRWSPDSKRIAYVSDRPGSAQLHLLWTETNRTA